MQTTADTPYVLDPEIRAAVAAAEAPPPGDAFPPRPIFPQVHFCATSARYWRAAAATERATHTPWAERTALDFEARARGHEQRLVDYAIAIEGGHVHWSGQCAQMEGRSC